MAVALKHCIFDGVLEKLKCVWEAFFTILQNKLQPFKRILAELTWGQIFTDKVLQLILSDFLQMEQNSDFYQFWNVIFESRGEFQFLKISQE